MRIARFRYTNVLPFHWRNHEHAEIELVDCIPSDIRAMVESGAVDACPMPVTEIASAEDFEPLERYAIAARRSVWSVTLFSRTPIDELSGATIAVTRESSTSAALLRLLLEQRHGHTGITYVEPGNAAADAELLIGDSALLRSAQGTPGLSYDLAAEWYAWQALPFVFARWMVKRSLPPWDKQRLADMLGTSLRTGMARIDELASSCALAQTLQAGNIAAYLKNLTYILDVEDERGQRRFIELLGQRSSVNREGHRV